MVFLGRVKDVAVRRQVLRSMVLALEGKVKPPPAPWRPIFARLKIYPERINSSCESGRAPMQFSTRSSVATWRVAAPL